MTDDAETPRPEFAAWAGHAESDNLPRAPDPERGSYDSVGVFITAAHESSRLSGDINSNIEFRSYSLSDVDDETLGRLDGTADFNVAADIFHWHFRETYDQGRTDAFAAWSPGNREDINVFSSGPRLDLPLGQRTFLTIGGVYSARRYDDSTNADSNSVVYDFGVFRQIRQTTDLGIIASANDVDYRDAGIAPYEIETLSLRYDKTLATGRALVEWGTNEISSQGQASDEPFFNLEWFRNVTARSTLSVGATQRFADSGTLAAPPVSDAPPPAESDVLVSAAPLERQDVRVTYSITTPRTNVSLGVALTEDRYFVDTTLDNDAVTARFTISRSVSERLRFGLAFDNITREFTDTVVGGQEDKDRMTTGWVDRALGRRFSVSLVLSRYERRGTGPFDEDRYEVRFTYSPTESSGAALAHAGL